MTDTKDKPKLTPDRIFEEMRKLDEAEKKQPQWRGMWFTCDGPVLDETAIFPTCEEAEKEILDGLEWLNSTPPAGFERVIFLAPNNGKRYTKSMVKYAIPMPVGDA